MNHPVLLILLKPLHIPSWIISSIFQQPTFVRFTIYIYYSNLQISIHWFFFLSNEMKPLFHFSRKDSLDIPYPCVEDLILNNILWHLARNNDALMQYFPINIIQSCFLKLRRFIAYKDYSLIRIHLMFLLSLSYPAKFYNLTKLTIDWQIPLPICKNVKYFYL